MTPEKLREIATYSIGEDLRERINRAAEFQQQQRDALLEAAADIETLTARIADLEGKRA